MSRRIEILSRETVFNNFFRIIKARLRFEKYDGTMSDEVTRLVFERGDSVAALVHDQEADTLTFTEQFRYPTVGSGSGWILEIPAGSVEEGEQPADTMTRELEEEIGLRVEGITPIHAFYVSPGGTSERIHLYYALVTPEHYVSEGGGLASEHENIRVVTMTVKEAFAQMWAGQIHDAKTLIALQWLHLRRQAHA
jgi:nudix-type nucleoside diphosphatase (YffH/AdpP family)